MRRSDREWARTVVRPIPNLSAGVFFIAPLDERLGYIALAGG
jgi:hypothetical protein